MLVVALAVGVPLVASAPAGAAAKPKKPDLVVPVVTATASAAPKVTATVRDRGKACARGSRTSFYASTDRRQSRSDTLIARRATRRLCVNRKQTLTQALDLAALPASMQTFYVVVCADARKKVRESNERNNCRASRALTPKFKVLVVTAGDPAAEPTAAGVRAIRAIGAAKFATVKVVNSAPQIAAQFTASNLGHYRAVVFLDTAAADLLTDAQQDTFEAYFRNGGGFVGIGSAIETEPAWTFYTDILGTRSSGKTGVQSGTIKVADRVHEASASLPEYWDRSDAWYSFTSNVRGVSHVLATVVEDPFGPQPQGQLLDGIAGGTMGADHPVVWCKDYRGGRSFYTALGNTATSFDEAAFRSHLEGAIDWAAGVADPHYSDCGATVLSNYEQVKITTGSSLNEPIGFDQLPDGRIIQTARTGTVRLHNPATGTTQVLADFADPSLPLTQRLYTNSEDGLYGPAVDNNFATNHWVYLYYAPQTVTNVKLSDGSIVTQTTPATTVPNSAA